jgi:hypothetical protein
VVGNITSVNYLFYDWDELAVATGFSRQHQLPVRSSPTSFVYPRRHARPSPYLLTRVTIKKLFAFSLLFLEPNAVWAIPLSLGCSFTPTHPK